MGQVPGTLQYVMPFAHVTAFSEKGERGEGKEIEEVILLKIKPCMPPPPLAPSRKDNPEICPPVISPVPLYLLVEPFCSAISRQQKSYCCSGATPSTVLF